MTALANSGIKETKEALANAIAEVKELEADVADLKAERTHVLAVSGVMMNEIDRLKKERRMVAAQNKTNYERLLTVMGWTEREAPEVFGSFITDYPYAKQWRDDNGYFYE